MLEEIRVRNFAIIDHLELTFGNGLNVITGETGAGKSIIIDAVQMLLGAKADVSMVRAGEDKAIIEGVFGLDDTAQGAILPILERENLSDHADDGAQPVLTISREVRANGRSSARVNGVSVNLDVVSEIGAFLVDVHGQSAHLSLLKPSAHIDLLDRYAELMDARAALSVVVGRLGDVRREIQRLTADDATIKRRADRLRTDIEEIDAAELVPGEDEILKAERSRLANSETLARLTGEVVTLLYGDDVPQGQTAALDQLVQVAALLHKLNNIDPALVDDYDLAEAAAAQVEELALSMRRYADTVEFNPERLNEMEERLELINSLKRRFGSPTIEAILAYADRSREELEGIENSEERLQVLRTQEQSQLKHIGELGERISRARIVAAKRLSEGVVVELGDLRMARAQFEVRIEQRDDPDGCFVGTRRVAFNAFGIDTVEFQMSANPGEPLRPLAKVASGGEAARIMLALKRVLTQADQTETLIFDEIDQGIGGRVGTVVGEKLWGLSGDHQVLVVTHLAQLAGFADKHFRVQKQVSSGRTQTQIVPLTADADQVAEIAAMLGTVNESGLQSARELLGEARQYKTAHANPETPTQSPLF